MAEYKIKDASVEKIQAGGRLIQNLDFFNKEKAQHLLEGDIIILKDSNNQFIAKMLVGRQNKGLGWVFTLDKREFWDEALIEDRLMKAFEKRQSLLASSETTAFRLFNGEGDGIGGLTIDYYQGYLLINIYSQAVNQSIECILDILEEQLSPQGIYVTLRFEVDSSQKQIYLARGNQAESPMIIKENNINYAVYLGQNWMTGIFLDQRQVRNFVKQQSQNLRVLNLFSYTGAFSVAAAVGGANSTVSVDVANRSFDLTQEQFQVNNINLNSQQILVMDVFDYIDYAQKNNLKFDMIICDPPSFARTKKTTFSAEKDYKDLARKLFNLVAKDGYLILSTNHSQYTIDNFRQEMIQISQESPGQSHLIQQFELADDFPTSQDTMSKYLKVLVFYRES